MEKPVYAGWPSAGAWRTESAAGPRPGIAVGDAPLRSLLARSLIVGSFAAHCRITPEKRRFRNVLNVRTCLVWCDPTWCDPKELNATHKGSIDRHLRE